MPLTFIDIEKQKSWRIGIFFFLLLALYLAIFALIAVPFLPVTGVPTLQYWVVAGLIAVLVAGLHFWFSASDTVNDVTRSLQARPPDPKDDIHSVLVNIMQEIQIVTGGKRTIRSFVIPTLSLNALAVADLKGNAAIGITEGLLSRLTRPQLETVIAHEAHHILSGDCLETTVAAGLFGTYSATFEKLSSASGGRSFLSPGFFLAWLLLQLSWLVNMFISREREYRADAAAVRMTRNPTALAETLYLLSRCWRGAGFIGSGLEMLCIVNPRLSALDEADGFFSDLLSTHPPLKKRIDGLLAMAHSTIDELQQRYDGRKTAAAPESGMRYFAQDPAQKWQGPFTLAELSGQPWLSPLTWITRENGGPADRAWRTTELSAVFALKAVRKEAPPSDLACPVCRQQLVSELRESAPVLQCRFCSGILVENDKIPRILARTGRERPCSERMNVLARTVLADNQQRYTRQKLMRGQTHKSLHACPKCGTVMYRGFYSLAYPIEIDRCSFCGLTWFDQNELDILQCLIALKTAWDTADTRATGSSA
jgi:heat shock protein HtpX